MWFMWDKWKSFGLPQTLFGLRFINIDETVSKPDYICGETTLWARRQQKIIKTDLNWLDICLEDQKDLIEGNEHYLLMW